MKRIFAVILVLVLVCSFIPVSAFAETPVPGDTTTTNNDTNDQPVAPADAPEDTEWKLVSTIPGGHDKAQSPICNMLEHSHDSCAYSPAFVECSLEGHPEDTSAQHTHSENGRVCRYALNMWGYDAKVYDNCSTPAHSHEDECYPFVPGTSTWVLKAIVPVPPAEQQIAVSLAASADSDLTLEQAFAAGGSISLLIGSKTLSFTSAAPVSTGIPVGVYEVAAIGSSDSYSVEEVTKQLLIMEDTTALTVEIKITAAETGTKPSLTLKLVDSEDSSKAVAGAVFACTAASGNVTTDANGCWTFSDADLACGEEDSVSFTLSQTSAPEGYAVDSTAYTVTVSKNGSISVSGGSYDAANGVWTLTASPAVTTGVVVVEAELYMTVDGTDVSSMYRTPYSQADGMDFEMYVDGVLFKEFTLSPSVGGSTPDSIEIEDVPFGKPFEIRRVANNDWYNELIEGNFEGITEENPETVVYYGNWYLVNRDSDGTAFYIKVTDGSTGKGLAGVEYTLYSDSACTTSAGKITTDADGNGAVAFSSAGNYWIKQTAVPQGFKLDSTVYKLTVSSTWQKGESYPEVRDSNSSGLREINEVLTVSSELASAITLNPAPTVFDMTIKVVWHDLDSKTRPSYLYLIISDDGTAIKDATVTAADNWTCVVKNMPVDGKFSFLEAPAPQGYVYWYVREGNTFYIHNNNIPKTADDAAPVIYGLLSLAALSGAVITFRSLRKKES